MATTLDPIAPENPVANPIDQPGPGGTVLTVGVGKQFATISDAIAAAHDNDVIAVDAGTYVDTSNNSHGNVITAANVTIEGVGGMVHFEMGPQGLANGKGLLNVENGLTLKNFELSGATGPSGNLAGIRVDGGNLTVINSNIHNNQDGILDTPPAGSNTSVTIDHSEFANNGAGDGQSHNIYINDANSLTVTNSVFTGANVGHEIKSRAANTTITNNVIADGPTGTASYSIDIPDGGVANVSGNVIEKGPNASNNGIIHYGGEGLYSRPNSSLTVTNNTVINDDPNAGLIWNQAAAIGLNVTAQVSGNTLYNVSDANNKGLVNATNDTSLTVPASQEPGYSLAAPYLGGTSIVANTQPSSAGNNSAPATTTAVTTPPATTTPVTTPTATTTSHTTTPVTTAPDTTTPITTQPAATTPNTTTPAITAPDTTTPVTTQPAATTPNTTTPVTTAPDTTTPVTTQPAATTPNTTTPVTTAPDTATPVTTQPATTTPDTTTPVATAPATTTSGTNTTTGGAGLATITAGNVGNQSPTFVGGSGITTPTAGTGSLTPTAGFGGLGATFGSGTGSGTAGAGDASNFFNGWRGGTDAISSHTAGTDQPAFSGFGTNAITSQAGSNGNLNFLLADNTHIPVMPAT